MKEIKRVPVFLKHSVWTHRPIFVLFVLAYFQLLSHKIPSHTIVYSFALNRALNNVQRQDKKFELMLTRRAKAYSSSGSVVTHRSNNRARRRVTSFQSKRVTNYATLPTPVPCRHLVNDIDLCTPKSLKSLTPACAGLHEPNGSGLRLLKSAFNAENFKCRLSWFNSSHFVAIQY